MQPSGIIALWTGETGDHRGALALMEQLLPDLTRVLGPDHPHTLTIRSNIAYLSKKGSPHRSVGG